MVSILERNKNIKPVKKTREEYAEDALYREVWEEVSNEKTQRFIKKYAKHLIIAAIVLVVIVAGIQFGVSSYNRSKVAAAKNYETAIVNMDAKALAALS